MLKHNIQTLDELEQHIKKKKDCCIVNPCGSGKTSVLSAFCKQHDAESIIIFTKQKNAEKYYKNMDPVFKKIKIITYNRMLIDYKNKETDAYDVDYFIADEAHYLGSEKWGQAFQYLRKKYKPIVIGITATPQRFEQQGTDTTIINTHFDGNSAGNFTTTQLQKQGVFVEPEYVVSLWNLKSDVETRIAKLEENTDIPDALREKHIEQLRDIYEDWKKTSNPVAVMKDKLPQYMYKPKCNRILVYAASTQDVYEKQKEVDAILKKIFHRKMKSYVYIHHSSETVLKDFLTEDNNYIKVLYSINKIMETIHIDDLNIAFMLRPSVSDRIITQQFGRINSIGNSQKALILDMVGNLANLGSTSFHERQVGTSDKIKTGNTTYTKNFQYVKTYMSVFAAIDSVLRRSTQYDLNGVRGSIKQLCSVFNKDYNEVKKLIHDKNMFPTDAVLAAREKNMLTSQEAIDENNMNAYWDFEFPEERRSIADQNIDIVASVIESRNIQNEDMCQTLYLEYYYRIAVANEETLGRIRGYLNVALNNKYIRMCRHEQTRNQIYEPNGMVKLKAQTIEYIEDMACCDSVNNELRNLVFHSSYLTERQRIILVRRYGLIDDWCWALDDVGALFDRTRETIRQAEAKGIRRLRSPIYRKWHFEEEDFRHYDAVREYNRIKEEHYVYCNA